MNSSILLIALMGTGTPDVAPPLPPPTIACMYGGDSLEEDVFIGVIAPSEEAAMTKCVAHFGTENCNKIMCHAAGEDEK